MKSRFITHIFLLTILLLSLFLANLFLGPVILSITDLKDDTFLAIFFDIRLPKSCTAVIVGASLALCGMLMQNLFRNPLAGPYVLGISSGAGLFVAITVLFIGTFGFSGNYFFGKALISVSAISGALFVTIIVLIVSKKTGSNITVLLIGIMISQILGALQGLLEYVSNAESLKNFVIWGMGSLSNTTNKDVLFIAPFVLIVFVCALFLAKPLNAILLSDTYAVNLGINVTNLRLLVIIITAILIGVVTAFCGPIAFVGLSVPIACRLIFKTAHQFRQMLYCLFMGAIVLLFCDTVCQLLSNTLALPINTVTTLVGSPVVIYLLFKTKLNS